MPLCAGRLHFFFPDSRLALDLNTDKTLKVDLHIRCQCDMLLAVGSGYTASAFQPLPSRRLLQNQLFPAMQQEARFDRHFVRDLTWSRHQLEELANRRFIAAQHSARYSAQGQLCLQCPSSRSRRTF
jgi:hypothetical protein